MAKGIKNVQVTLEDGKTINVSGNVILITDEDMSDMEKAQNGDGAVKVAMMVNASGKFVPVAAESILRYIKANMPDGLAELVAAKALMDDDDEKESEEKNRGCGCKRSADDLFGMFMMDALLRSILG